MEILIQAIKGLIKANLLFFLGIAWILILFFIALLAFHTDIAWGILDQIRRLLPPNPITALIPVKPSPLSVLENVMNIGAQGIDWLAENLWPFP